MDLEARETQSCIERAVGEAFLTAHLLTASVQEAERAVMASLNTLDLEGSPEKLLQQRVLNEAVQANGVADTSADQLPVELRPVLRLSAQLRRCFVLRTLVGSSLMTCARMLRLHPDQVAEYTCAAHQLLPSLARPTVMIERMAWTMD